jgi:hypothetical protein
MPGASMTDKELNAEIKALLGSEKTIPQARANLLMIAMLSDIRDNVTKQSDRIKIVEDTSIVLWVRKNKLVAALGLLAALLLDAYGAGKYILQAILKSMGVDLPIEL